MEAAAAAAAAGTSGLAGGGRCILSRLGLGTGGKVRQPRPRAACKDAAEEKAKGS